MKKHFLPATNLRYLMQRPSENFAVLDGLRALSCLWIVGFHVVWFSGFFYGGEAFSELYASPALRVLNVASYSIGVFFVLSGFLIGFLLFRELDSSGTINFRRFYLRRLWRLWPAYTAVLLLYCVTIAINCQNAWANILYVNNFLDADDHCMAWGWSLAIEEQFYLICPIFLLILTKINSSRKQVVCLVGLLLSALLIRTWIVFSADAVGAAIHPELDKELYSWHFDNLYIKPWARYGELLLGVGLAFVYSRKPLWEALAGSAITRPALLLTAAVFIGMIFGPTSDILIFDHFHAWYLAIAGQFMFALAITALIMLVLLQSTVGAVLFAPLEWKIWYPFAQLSYSLYLTHPIVIMIFYVVMQSRIKEPPDATMIYMIYPLILLISLVLSLLVYLLVERPCLNIRNARG